VVNLKTGQHHCPSALSCLALVVVSAALGVTRIECAPLIQVRDMCDEGLMKN
jgi:hypothetical protein